MNNFIGETSVPGQVQAMNFSKLCIAEYTAMYFALTSVGIWVIEREMYTGYGNIINFYPNQLTYKNNLVFFINFQDESYNYTYN